MNPTMTIAILALGSDPNMGEQLIFKQTVERAPLAAESKPPLRVERYVQLADLGKVVPAKIEISDWYLHRVAPPAAERIPNSTSAIKPTGDGHGATNVVDPSWPLAHTPVGALVFGSEHIGRLGQVLKLERQQEMRRTWHLRMNPG